MKLYYLLLAFAFVLTGCKGGSDKVPETFNDASDKGLIVGTITFDNDKPQNDIYRFFYEPVSGDKKFIKRNSGKVLIKGREKNVRGFNGDFNDKRTYIFVAEREPGSYAFIQYNYLNHIGPSGMVSFSDKYAIPFEVKKGEITYVGEMEFLTAAIPGTPRIIVSSSMARDLAELKKKYPGINWETAIDRTPKTGDTGAGIVEFR